MLFLAATYLVCLRRRIQPVRGLGWLHGCACVRRPTDGWMRAIKNGLVNQVHMVHTSASSPFLKVLPMTFDTKTPVTPTPAAVQLKPEQHHSKAAEHLELAAKSHKEVAKLIGANDHTGAQAHVKVAQEHLTQAHTHAEAAKKAMPAAK